MCSDQLYASKPLLFCVCVCSWRELDSVCGVSEKHVGSDGQCVNHSDTPQQPNGEGLEHKGEVSVQTCSVPSVQ